MDWECRYGDDAPGHYKNVGLSVKVAVTVITLPGFLWSPAVPDLLENGTIQTQNQSQLH